MYFIRVDLPDPGLPDIQYNGSSLINQSVKLTDVVEGLSCNFCENIQSNVFSCSLDIESSRRFIDQNCMSPKMTCSAEYSIAFCTDERTWDHISGFSSSSVSIEFILRNETSISDVRSVISFVLLALNRLFFPASSRTR